MGNFGAFDPALAIRGVVGLTHFSKADEAIWTEFSNNWDALVIESEQLLTSINAPLITALDSLDFVMSGSKAEVEFQPSHYGGETERIAATRIRLGQDFFRRAVLSSYRFSCCVCSLDIPELLTASHIIGWAKNEQTRVDPHNGLCLCALHDRAFDRGMIAVDEEYKILVSTELAQSRSPFANHAFEEFRQKAIILPQRFLPKAEYLRWHREHSFQL